MFTEHALTTIAQVAHEANRAYCDAVLGDHSQPPWREAPAWQRESAVDGVKAVIFGDVKFPADSHNRWMKHKADAGWTYGPVKDPTLKLHPCMRPWSELPETQQKKDLLFLAVVRACAGITG